MGYTTDFIGKFDLSRTLTVKEKSDLDAIHEKDWRDDDTRPADNAFYCQWLATDDGASLEWDGEEKFYNYVEWLEWLIKNFFEPRGIKLNGEVEWEGEERDDIGKIIVEDNKVRTRIGSIIYGGE